MLVGVKIAQQSIRFQERVGASKTSNLKHERKRWGEMSCTCKRQVMTFEPIKSATYARSSWARCDAKPIVPKEGSHEGDLSKKHSSRHKRAVRLRSIHTCLSNEFVLGTRCSEAWAGFKVSYQPVLHAEICEDYRLGTRGQLLGQASLRYSLNSGHAGEQQRNVAFIRHAGFESREECHCVASA